MFTAENCPYIVIGIPAFVPKSEASVGFALASRRIKSMASAPFEVQDLTAALSRIESGETGNQLMYAIPADFDLFTSPAPEMSGATGELSATQLLEMAEVQLTEPDRERVASLLLRRGLDDLLKWNWNQADLLLKSCLRISNDERIRDEALNLLAACLVMDGDTERAVQALSKAVEGQWNLRLQANLAMLALEIEPKRAIDQMSFLVDGATGATEKLMAVKMAIGLWRQVQQDELGTNDIEEFDPLPGRLLNSFIETLRSPDISEEDFFDLGLFLARVAPISVTREALSTTKYRGKASAEIIFARSGDFSFYIENVVRFAIQDRQRDKCVDAHIDGIVEEVCRGLFDDQRHLFWIGFAFVQQGLDVSTMHRTWLRGALVLALTSILDENVSPNENFFIWLREAKQNQKQLDLPEELRNITAELMNDASDQLMRLQLRDFFEMASDVENMSNQIGQQMNGFWNRLGADRSEIRRRSQAGIQWCNAQLRMFAEYEALGLTDPDLRREVSRLRNATSVIRENLQRFS